MQRTSRLVLTVTMACMVMALLASCQVQPPQPPDNVTNTTEINNQFAEINNQFTEKFTEINNQFTEKFTEINNQFTGINKKLKPEGEPLTYQIDYMFGDFDPVSDSSEINARLDFCTQLGGELDKWIKRGFQITPLMIPPVPYPPLPSSLVKEERRGRCNTLINRPVKVAEKSFAFGFTLMNAQASLSPLSRTSDEIRTHEEEINATIKELAERNTGSRELAIPVRVDRENAPLFVQREARDYRATSGVPDVELDEPACTQEIPITLTGVAKEGAEIAYVVARIGDKVVKEVRTLDNVIHYGGVACVGTTDIESYILVTLEDPVVAQYYRLQVTVDADPGSKRGDPPTIEVAHTHLPVPLIEGAPACPPSDVGWAAPALKGVLEKMAGHCR